MDKICPPDFRRAGDRLLGKVRRIYVTVQVSADGFPFITIPGAEMFYPMPPEVDADGVYEAAVNAVGELRMCTWCNAPALMKCSDTVHMRCGAPLCGSCSGKYKLCPSCHKAAGGWD